MDRRLGPLLCAAALAIAFPSATRAADPAQAEAYLAAAAKSLQKNDPKTAAIQLRNAVQSDPDNGTAHYELGTVALQLGDLGAAELQLRAALEHGYDRAKATAPLAETLLRLERNQQLLDEIPPGDRPPELEASVRVARGYALLNLHRPDDARQSFEQAAAMAAKPAPALFGLARALGAGGDTMRAVEILETALGDDPKFVDGWVYLGQLQRTAGKLAGAQASFDKALALSPADVPARLERASLLIALDDLTAAEADIGAILAANPQDPLGNYLQALAYSNRQNYRAAEISLQKMRGGLYAYPPAIYLLAEVNLAQDQLAQADDNVTRYLARMPNDEAGMALFATVLLRRNNMPRAIAFLKGAIDANPSSLRLLGLLGEAYVRDGKKEEAAAILDRLAVLAPRDADVMTQIAALRLRIGQADSALGDLEAAAALAPRSVRTGLLLVLTYLDAGRVDDAGKAAEALRDSLPDDPLPENLLGAIALRAGSAAEARAHFEAALRIRPDFLPAETNLGQLLLAERDIAGARRIFDAILARDAVDAAALKGEADLSLLDGKAQDAAAWLEKARAADATALEPRLRLVEAYISLAAPKKAAAIAGEIEKLAPDDPRALSAIGAARLADNEIPAAIAAFGRLVKATPDSSGAQLQLARAYYAARDDANARAALERAAALDPGDAAIEQQLTRFAIETASVPRELAYLQGLADAKPDDPAYDRLAGNLALAAGDAAVAATRFAAGLAKRPGDAALVAKLAEAEGRSDPAQAAKTLADWLRSHPEAPALRLALADRLLGMKRYDEAAAAYEAVLRAAPDDLAATNNLAWLYALKNDKRAVGLAEAAYRREPGNPDIADTLAWVLVRSGENARGLSLLESAAAVPDAPLEMRYHLAVALKNAGRTDEARRALAALIATGRTFDSRAEAAALLKALPPG
jgi:cellulose synthase operon protein C